MATASPEAVKQRAKAALLGGLVADAATMGLHWIYKPEVLQEALDKSPGSAEAPEFYNPPACPFYQSANGDLSPYGHELLALLKYLVTVPSGAPIDGQAAAQSLADTYKALLKLAEDKKTYVNKSSKHVLAAIEGGQAFPETGDPTDAQANAFVKAPAVVARFTGSPQLGSAVDVAVRVQQNNPPAVSAGQAGALILDRVVQGASIAEAVEWAVSPGSGLSPEVVGQLQAALALKADDYTATVAALGLSCGLPHSLQNAVLAAAKFDSYVDGVRANILAGGDNASRSVLIGALLAAQAGSVEAAIPEKWRASVTGFAEYEKLADQLLA